MVLSLSNAIVTTSCSPASRKVGITHMAFYRGWLQGLPLREMADAYLETGLDLRLAKSTLAWVQDELRRAALRHGRHGEARLLRLRITEIHAVSGQAAELPSIDDFQEDFDPTGFYSHDELMTHYLERYPQASNDRARKRAALLERQLRTLNWLEVLLVTSPVPADPVEAWLDPSVVSRLRRGGITTLASLVQRIADRGYRWYNTVPQLGEIRAKRLLKWITTYRESLGQLPEYATVRPAALTDRQKRRPLTLLSPSGNPAEPADVDGDALPAIVPLEAMLLPRTAASPATIDEPLPEQVKDGSRILASNDREALESWLNAQAGSPATFRAYRKEGERLVLWAACERGLTLGAMTVDDCMAYRDWLCTLGRVDDAAWPFQVPQASWFSPRYVKRYSPAWRPFEGALSPKSVIYALTVCRTLFRWLARVRYLAFDPWPAVANPRALAGPAPDMELTHVLSRADWDCLMESIDAIADEAHRVRARLLMRLALVTGMRLSELADARCDRIYSRPMRDGSGARWMLKVLGKGAKWRAVPLTDDVLQLLRESLRLRGLPDDPASVPAGTAILARLVDGEPMTDSGVAKVVKGLFADVARRLLDAGERDHARAFERASTHWIRHTTGSFLGNDGAPPSQIQQLLGHASVATTTIYTGTGEDELFATVNQVLGSG